MGEGQPNTSQLGEARFQAFHHAAADIQMRARVIVRQSQAVLKIYDKRNNGNNGKNGNDNYQAVFFKPGLVFLKR